MLQVINLSCSETFSTLISVLTSNATFVASEFRLVRVPCLLNIVGDKCFINIFQAISANEMNSLEEYGGDASEEAAVQNRVSTSYNQSRLACIFLLNLSLVQLNVGVQVFRPSSSIDVASNLIVDLYIYLCSRMRFYLKKISI